MTDSRMNSVSCKDELLAWQVLLRSRQDANSNTVDATQGGISSDGVTRQRPFINAIMKLSEKNSD